jgi:hypothetical protein
MGAPTYAYDAIRPWLATGTVILWQGNDLLGRAIRLFTEFSHASLVVRELDPLSIERVDVIEALATGLEMRHLSERMAGYNGRVFAFRPLDLTADIQARVKSFALDECGKGVRYDYAGLFANALGRVSEGANRYFCSEFAARALEQGGIARLKAHRNGEAARPGDIPVWFDGVLREIEVAR